MEIGTQVKRAREQALLTQEELAERAGIGAATLNRIERDRVEPQFRTIRKIAKALGVDATTLISKDRDAADALGVEAVSLEQWLEDRCGHSYLAMSSEELARFIEDAEDLDEQLQRRQLLREEIDVVWAERKRFPATEQRNIAGVPFEQIHTRWIRTLFVAVGLQRMTPEDAEREVQELALA
jgi:transcriptional regulator with XRE-family HTH domain